MTHSCRYTGDRAIRALPAYRRSLGREGLRVLTPVHQAADERHGNKGVHGVVVPLSNVHVQGVDEDM